MEAHTPFNYEVFRQQAVQKLRTGEQGVAGIQGLLAPVINDLLETALRPDSAASRQAHNVAMGGLGGGQRPELPQNRPTRNRHAGPYRRPPLRPEESDPKHLEREVLDLYTMGSSYQTIQDRFALLYQKRVEVDELITITNQLLPKMRAWQRRSLQPVYACLWVTHQTCHLWQDGALRHRTAYSVISIDLQGNRDILGHYVDERQPTEFWPHLLQDLKGRGNRDLLLMCVEGAAEVEPIVHQVYPQTHVHGCLLHQMRGSLLSIKGTDALKLRKELQTVYQAPSLTEAAVLWQTVKAT